MEKEVSKSSRKVKTQLPVNGDVIARCGQFFSHEKIAAIGVPALQRIASHHSPDVIAPLLALLKKDDFNGAVDILRSLTTEPPAEFVTAVGWIGQMTHEIGADLLSLEGLTPGVGESRGDFAARAYFDHFEKFSAAVLKCIERNSFGQRSFNVFQADRPLDKLKMNSLDADADAKATKLCREHFNSREYGPHCIIIRHTFARRLGYLIEHGTQRAGRSGFDLAEKAVSRLDRDRRMDFVFFDTKTKTLWISSRSSRDVSFYAELMGTVLYGDPGLFSRRVKFDLSFAITDDLADRLSEIPSGRMKAVRLKFRGIQKVGQKKKLYENAENKHDCLSSHDERLEGYHDNGTVFGITLRVDLASEKSLHQDITVKSGSVHAGPLLHDTELQCVMLGLGIVGGYADA